MIPFIIALCAAALDQWSKMLALSHLRQGSFALIPDVFHLTYLENTGMAWGMFSGNNSVLAAVMALIILAISIWLWRQKPRQWWVQVGAGLLIGGALGNLIDRLYRGFVVDFFDFRLIHFPVFNVADTCVCLGMVLIVWYLLWVEGKDHEA